MRTDGVDISEFQHDEHSPKWSEMFSYDLLAVRVCDGRYLDPSLSYFIKNFNSLPTKYKILYVLPDSRISPQDQIDIFVDHASRSGMTFPLPSGWGIMIDDESTMFHGQYTGQTMRDFRNRLHAVCNRTNSMFYTHPLHSNYGFCANEGWPSWFPWPVNRNVRASDQIIVPDVHQWGVAGPGEQFGFPTVSVDCNQINNRSILDIVCNSIERAPAPPTIIKDDEEDMRLKQIVQTDNPPKPGNGTVFIIDGVYAYPVSSAYPLSVMEANGVLAPKGDNSPGKVYNVDRDSIYATYIVKPELISTPDA